MKFKSVCRILVTTMLLSISAPGVKASADSANGQSSTVTTSTALASTTGESNPSTSWLPSVTEAHSSTNYDSTTDTTTVTITDSQMRDILTELGVSNQELGLYGLTRSNGSNYISWQGNKLSGNVNIGISENTLKLYRIASAAGNLVGIIYHTYSFNYPKAGLALLTAIKHTVAAGKITSGEVYKIRHWTSVSVSKQ